MIALYVTNVYTFIPPPTHIHRVVGCCNHWYELMVAKLLYTFPLVTSADYDLIYIADSAVKMFSSLERGAVDDIIMAALRFDVMELVKLCR